MVAQGVVNLVLAARMVVGGASDKAITQNNNVKFLDALKGKTPVVSTAYPENTGFSRFKLWADSLLPSQDTLKKEVRVIQDGMPTLYIFPEPKDYGVFDKSFEFVRAVDLLENDTLLVKTVNNNRNINSGFDSHRLAWNGGDTSSFYDILRTVQELIPFSYNFSKPAKGNLKMFYSPTKQSFIAIIEYGKYAYKLQADSKGYTVEGKRDGYLVYSEHQTNTKEDYYEFKFADFLLSIQPEILELCGKR